MFSPVWDRVVTGNYRASSAILKGYSRFAVINETYPVIVPGSPDEQFEGVLYYDVDLADVVRLDAFEGAYYVRQTVTLVVGGDQTVQAHAYILNQSYNHIMSEKRWDPEMFYQQAMFEFIEAYCGFTRHC